MPITVEGSGFRRQDDGSWVDPVTGDSFSLRYFDQVPNLPAALHAPQLRHELAVQVAEAGGLVEAHVVPLDSVPALLQVVKLPLPDRPGLGFVATLTVPKATCSAQLRFQAVEGPMTGMREATVLSEVGPQGYFGEHPYAPEIRGKLPWHHGDDPEWDVRFPAHPLSRARHWLRQMLNTARLDPEFAELPPYPGPPPPPPQIGERQTAVTPGIPIGGYLPLWFADRVTFWRMAEPQVPLAQLGIGTLSRSQVQRNNFRESVLIDDNGATLLLTGRHPGTEGGVPAIVTEVTEVDEQEALAGATKEAVTEAFRWVGRAAAAAALRGDYLAVDPAAATRQQTDPYCTIVVRPQGDGTHAVIETGPVPVGAPFWADDQPADGPCQTKGRRIDLGDAEQVSTQFAALGLLAMFAVSTWPVHPLRLCLSFGRNIAMLGPADG